jgi:hypothetical protein
MMLFLVMGLGMAGLGLIYFPSDTLNVPFLGKAIVFVCGITVIYIGSTMNREHTAYWAAKDREADDKRRAVIRAIDLGRMSGLWP